MRVNVSPFQLLDELQREDPGVLITGNKMWDFSFLSLKGYFTYAPGITQGILDKPTELSFQEGSLSYAYKVICTTQNLIGRQSPLVISFPNEAGAQVHALVPQTFKQPDHDEKRFTSHGPITQYHAAKATRYAQARLMRELATLYRVQVHPGSLTDTHAGIHVSCDIAGKVDALVSSSAGEDYLLARIRESTNDSIREGFLNGLEEIADDRGAALTIIFPRDSILIPRKNYTLLRERLAVRPQPLKEVNASDTYGEGSSGQL